MIVFFSYKKSFLKYIPICLKYFKYDYIVLSEPDEHYFEKACVIIPIGISAQNELNHDYSKYKHKFLTSSEDTYENLDDKIRFYRYVKKYNLLENTGIELIPT